MNGHGGNQSTLDLAVRAIDEALSPTFIGSLCYYSAHDKSVEARFPDHGFGGHACGGEVSLAMELRPDLVKYDALAAMVPGPGAEQSARWGPLVRGGLKLPTNFRDLTANGCLGDATKASPALGAALVASEVDNIVAFIEQVVAGG